MERSNNNSITANRQCSQILHMEMSLLGSIGNLMAGSGLQEVLQVVYASSTLNHMLSGIKAVCRALRGHLLVDVALHTILLADAYNVLLPLKDNRNKPKEETTSKGAHDDVIYVEMQVADNTVVTDLPGKIALCQHSSI